MTQVVRGWQPSPVTLAHLVFLFSFPIFLRISIGLTWELQCEILWEGRMIGWKLDLVWSFHGMLCIDDSTWFLKACLCSSRFSFLVIFGAFCWNFRGEVLGAFLWGILVGCHVWGPCASLLGDLAPTNSPKRLRFWWFLCSSCSWGRGTCFTFSGVVGSLRP
jgi:hypothetical protein